MKQMRINFSFYLGGLFMVFGLPVAAQQSSDLLTLSDAVQKALEKNYDIRLAEVDLDQAKINNTAGNAGMLPRIDVGGGLTGEIKDSRTKFATGDEQNVSNAASWGVQAGVALDWVLFDGLQMFVRKDRLETLVTRDSLLLKSRIQNTISDVIVNYAAVLREKQRVVALDTAVSLAQTRMEISKRKFETGLSAKTDYLQAQVDYNARRSDLIAQTAALRTAKDSLILLLGMEQFAQFQVQDSIPLHSDLKFSSEDTWLNDNYSYRVAGQDRVLAEYDLKLAKGAQWPQVSLQGAYNYARNQNAAGFSLFNRSLGPEAGLQISIPVFDGFNLRRNRKIARQELFRSELQQARLRVTLRGRYRLFWRHYQNAITTLRLEEENLNYAEENVMIQQERFRVGVSNTLELREAENSYVAAMTRLVEARYNVKVAETQLLVIENKLIR